MKVKGKWEDVFFKVGEIMVPLFAVGNHESRENYWDSV